MELTRYLLVFVWTGGELIEIRFVANDQFVAEQKLTAHSESHKDVSKEEDLFNKILLK